MLHNRRETGGDDKGELTDGQQLLELPGRLEPTSSEHLVDKFVDVSQPHFSVAVALTVLTPRSWTDVA